MDIDLIDALEEVAHTLLWGLERFRSEHPLYPNEIEALRQHLPKVQTDYRIGNQEWPIILSLSPNGFSVYVRGYCRRSFTIVSDCCMIESTTVTPVIPYIPDSEDLPYSDHYQQHFVMWSKGEAEATYMLRLLDIIFHREGNSRYSPLPGNGHGSVDLSSRDITKDIIDERFDTILADRLNDVLITRYADQEKSRLLEDLRIMCLKKSQWEELYDYIHQRYLQTCRRHRKIVDILVKAPRSSSMNFAMIRLRALLPSKTIQTSSAYKKLLRRVLAAYGWG